MVGTIVLVPNQLPELIRRRGLHVTRHFKMQPHISELLCLNELTAPCHYNSKKMGKGLTVHPTGVDSTGPVLSALKDTW